LALPGALGSMLQMGSTLAGPHAPSGCGREGRATCTRVLAVAERWHLPTWPDGGAGMWRKDRQMCGTAVVPR
jgi:hypothetical protein